ncbi:hypothetical protein IPM09_01560 [Candidatus Saccharibacteria bacterium]|nr:MAG: hypothetical protein IPM09_01560 [Candidatus Saccharibacteria bacterium]
MIKFWQKLKKQVRDGNEKGAREAVLEDLFNDFNRNRFTIYKFNFMRGIFFGFGSVLGGTVVIAAFVALLNITGHLVPSIADFLRQIIDVMDRAKR